MYKFDFAPISLLTIKMSILPNSILFVAGGFTKGSNKRVHHPCELKSSELCKGTVENPYYAMLINYEKNVQTIVCRPCAQRTKMGGRNNPFCKYKSLDDNFFRVVDTV